MRKLVSRLFIILIAIYAVYIFISQQKMLNTYAAEKKQYTNQIEKAQKEQAELTETLDGLNSTNYIEDIARNKLDMYLPNERVYIDITN